MSENFTPYGKDLFGNPVVSADRNKAAVAPMQDRWTWPPFTVLDARQGEWQERKRAWIALGIQSELGRGAAMTWGIDPSERSTTQDGVAWTESGKAAVAAGAAAVVPFDAGKHMAFGDGASGTAAASPLPGGSSPGRGLLSGATERAGFGADYDTSKGENAWGGSGTSIFDPVLTELLVRWFSPPGGHVLDPFAGGSVRGIVAAMLGRRYTGVDLSAVQLEANRAQAARICPGNAPTWVHGDSAAVLPTLSVQADCVIACPPYYDLEVYSDHPADISNMTWEQFAAAYTAIIKAACALLKPDRFAVFVVGDIRDKRGMYRGFPQLTVAAFQAAGLSYYNEAVLVTSVGSLPIRAGKQFAAGRKLGRTHQSILGFVKGDPKRAAQACELAAAEREALPYETEMPPPVEEPAAAPAPPDDDFDDVRVSPEEAARIEAQLEEMRRKSAAR